MRVGLQSDLFDIELVTREVAESISIVRGARLVELNRMEEALRFLRRFQSSPGALSALRSVAADAPGPMPAASMDDYEVLSLLARRIASGQLMVVARPQTELARQRARPRGATPLEVERSRALPPPEPSPRRAPPPPPQETMVEAPVAQAQTLESAAESGAPFCEP